MITDATFRRPSNVVVEVVRTLASLGPLASFLAILVTAFIVAVLLMTFGAFAQTVVATPEPTTINFGTAINQILMAVVTAIVGIISAVGISLMQAIKARTGLDVEKLTKDIEWLHNGTIQRFVENQAGQFLAQFDSIAGMKIDVHNPDIARLANQALTKIPDALERFGIGPADVAKRIGDLIVAKIGILTASASMPTTVTMAAPDQGAAGTTT